ncbi:MAG: glycosyl hydrolase family 18 protein [Candidatus Neomarinimicrobiota bacterium]
MPNAFTKTILIPVVCLGLLAGQPFKSIHQQQAEFYADRYIAEDRPQVTAPLLPKLQRSSAPSHKIFGYHPYWSGRAWENYNYNLLTTIAWFSVGATATGSVTNYNGWPDAGLINLAHSNGVDVVLCVTLFDGTALTTLLSSPTYRQNLINNLIALVKSGNGDGVNIDFEAFPAGQKANMVQFITDLTSAFHNQIPGSQVTLAMPAVDWSDKWDYNALATVSDGLFIMGYDFFGSWSETTGPVAPLTGYTYNITWSVNDYITKTGGKTDKLMLGVPYYGRKWQTAGDTPGSTVLSYIGSPFYAEAEALALTYGSDWYATTQTPWIAYQSGSWYQVWYDDSLSLSLKYDLALDKDLGGVGMWALGYDGSSSKLWSALQAKFGATTPPLTPENLSINNIGGGSIAIQFSGAENADNFTVLRAYADQTTIDTLAVLSQRPLVLNGLDLNQCYFLKIYASNDFGDSPVTELLGVVPVADVPQILVINGFDRMSGTNNSRDFIRQHGTAILATGQAFDAASNESVINGFVNLADYAAIDWILGEEGATNSSFTGEEQLLVADYLKYGGQLFLSGSEIGYDLVAQGSTADQDFYSGYLKAEYLTDAAGDGYSATAVSSSCLDGLGSFSFDNGTQGTYNVDYPDGIKPAAGAADCLRYTGVDYATRGGAGIQYQGSFDGGNMTGAVVYLAFGFETIYPEATRNLIMERILDFFTLADTGTDVGSPLPQQFGITAVYPNPSNTVVNISYRLPNLADGARLQIVNILGQTVVTMTDLPTTGGSGELTWNALLADGKPAPTGVYLAVLNNTNQITIKKFTLLK